MAVVAESFELAKLPNDLHFLGCQQGNESETVLITCTECVYMYHVTDQKLLQSWPVTGHGSQITCPAQWSQDKSAVVYVENKKVIHIVKSQKTKKSTMKELIHKVFVAGKRIVVLFENGSVCFASDHAHSSQPQAAPGESILFADCVEVGDGLCVLVVLQEEDTANGRMLCHWYRESSSEWTLSSSQTSLSAGQDFCCTAVSDGAKLFSLERSGRLTVTRVTPGGSSSTELGQVEGHALTAVSPTQLALAGWSKAGQEGVGIYNADFDMLQAWRAFPSKMSEDKPKLHCLERHLVLTSGQQVQVLPYHCSSSLLISGISRAGPPSPDSTHSQNADIPQYDVLNSSKTATQAKFRAAFDKLLRDLRQGDLHPGQHDVLRSRLLQRCLAEKRFSTSVQIAKLIDAKFITRQDVMPIAEYFIEHKEVSLLSQLMKMETIMPEEFLVRCLSFYLSLGDKELSAACKGALVPENGVEEEEEDMETDADHTATAEGSNPFSPQRTQLVNEILSREVEEEVLLIHVRKLNFQHVKDLLKYLQHLWQPHCFSQQLVSNVCRVLSLQPASQESAPVSQEAVVCWMKCLADAHFSQLMLAPDARDLYRSLYQTSLLSMQDVEKACKAESILLNKISAKNKANKVSKRYSIEVLEL